MGNLDRPRYGITKLLLIVGVLLLATLGFAGAALADGPSISSDKADYMPGETVTLTGAGWQAGEVIDVFVIASEADGSSHWRYEFELNGDETGAFTLRFDLPAWFVALYSVTARGASGAVAQTTFTDSVSSVTLTSPTTPSPITLSTFPLTANVSFGYSTSTTGSTTGVASVATSPVTHSSTVSLTSGVSQSATIPVTLPATLLNGTYNATATVTNMSGGGSNQKSDSANNGVHVDVPITQLVFTAAPSTVLSTSCAKFIVESRDENGNPRNPFANLTVNISASSGALFSNNSCSSSATSVIIASNKTSMDFWFMASPANNTRVRVTASTSYEGGPTITTSQLV